MIPIKFYFSLSQQNLSSQGLILPFQISNTLDSEVYKYSTNVTEALIEGLETKTQYTVTMHFTTACCTSQPSKFPKLQPLVRGKNFLKNIPIRNSLTPKMIYLVFDRLIVGD